MEKFITLNDSNSEYTSTYQHNVNSKLNDPVSLSCTDPNIGRDKSEQNRNCEETEKDNSTNTITNTFKFIRKKQVNNDNDTILANENYFLSPSFQIKLYNPKIIEINQKYIVFKYCDNDKERLKNISDSIINLFKNSILLSSDTIINPLCTQYIRCTLPIPWSPYKKSHYRYLFDTYKGNVKYSIHSDNIKTLLNYNINKVIIDIKNIWKSDNKYGFNCIIKEIYVLK